MGKLCGRSDLCCASTVKQIGLSDAESADQQSLERRIHSLGLQDLQSRVGSAYKSSSVSEVGRGIFPVGGRKRSSRHSDSQPSHGAKSSAHMEICQSWPDPFNECEPRYRSCSVRLSSHEQPSMGMWCSSPILLRSLFLVAICCTEWSNNQDTPPPSQVEFRSVSHRAASLLISRSSIRHRSIDANVDRGLTDTMCTSVHNRVAQCEEFADIGNCDLPLAFRCRARRGVIPGNSFRSRRILGRLTGASR